MKLWTCPRASESIVAVLADSSEGVAYADSSVGEGVGGADDGAFSAVDLVGDDAGALHDQCSGFGDVSGFEFVDGGQVFVAAHQDGRCDAFDDAADEAVGDGSVVEGVECCFDGAATVVAEDDDEWHVEDSDGVFDGSEDGVVEDVAGGAHDEHVAEALVEDDFGGYARITAAEQHGGGVLPVEEFGAVGDSLAGVDG